MNKVALHLTLHHHPALLFIACGLVVLLISIPILYIDHTDAFKRRHPLLTMNGFFFVGEYILLPIVDKIVFLFTSSFYREQVIDEVKQKIEKSFKGKVDDLTRQIKMMEEAKTMGRKDTDYSAEKDAAYWDGVKYGYALKSRTSNDMPNKPTTLTDAHLFTLQEIANGNKTITGLAAAHLEDCGLVRIVWEDQKSNRLHYELTDSGMERLSAKTKRKKRA